MYACFALLLHSDLNICPQKTYFSYGPNVFLKTCSKESRKQRIVCSQIVPDTEAKCSGCLFSPYLEQCDGGTHPSCALLIITLWSWHAFHWICGKSEWVHVHVAMSSLSIGVDGRLIITHFLSNIIGGILGEDWSTFDILMTTLGKRFIQHGIPCFNIQRWIGTSPAFWVVTQNIETVLFVNGDCMVLSEHRTALKRENVLHQRLDGGWSL